MGFTLVELLVCLFILAVLVGLLLPAVSWARRASHKAACGSNLRSLGAAMTMYASQNRQEIPRSYVIRKSPVSISWTDMVVGPTSRPLREFGVLQCPAHPVVGIDTGYVINSFAFSDSGPTLLPRLYSRISRIKGSATFPYLLDAATDFHMPRDPRVPDDQEGVFFVYLHNVWDPRHFPDQGRERIVASRHGKNRINILFLDGHVDLVDSSALKLADFDDGDRSEFWVVPNPP